MEYSKKSNKGIATSRRSSKAVLNASKISKMSKKTKKDGSPSKTEHLKDTAA